ncbi:MAG TPA: ABC transporter substrate-binding protein [Actinopolymorphaceae bacterium]
MTLLRRRHALLATVVTVGLLVAGCASDPDAGKERSGRIAITYASFAGPTGLPAKFGQAKGFFEDAGLDVTFVKAEDPVALVSSGDVDIADSDTTSALIAAGKGAPIKIVSSMFRTKGPFYLLGDTDIASVKDLVGKKVGIGRKGSGLEAYTRVILRENGIDESQVTLVPNGSYQAALASVENDQVDATIIHEPFVSLAEAEKKGKLLAKGWDYLPTFHTGVEIAHERFIEENPEALRKFLAAYFEAAEYAKAHPDEFEAFAAERTNVPRGVQAKALEREEPIWDNRPKVELARLAQTQRIQQELGFQDEVYDPRDLVDDSYAPAGPERQKGRD